MTDKADTARKNRGRGKRNEKALASILDGERIGLFGGEDIRIGKKYSVEAKSRRAFVAENWMLQAEKNCKGKIPFVVVHLTGKNHLKDLVIMRLENFKELLI
jgi:hypothetical protein